MDALFPLSGTRSPALPCPPPSPALKVLFVTGCTPNAVVRGGGRGQFLSNPFTLEDLARKLRLVAEQAG